MLPHCDNFVYTLFFGSTAGVDVIDSLEVTPNKEAEGINRLVQTIAELDGDSHELRITVDSGEADRKRFGLQLFSGPEGEGLSVVIRPESGTISGSSSRQIRDSSKPGRTASGRRMSNNGRLE